MRITHFRCSRLQWSRARPITYISGYAAGHQQSRLATTGLQTRATVHTTRHSNIVATRTACFLKKILCQKTFRRASSTHVANPTTSTLPTTISGDATVVQITQLLRAHREGIEASSKFARNRRELVIARNIGIQAFNWLKQLDGLDERHVIPKELSYDIGWFLVAEGD